MKKRCTQAADLEKRERDIVEELESMEKSGGETALLEKMRTVLENKAELQVTDRKHQVLSTR